MLLASDYSALLEHTRRMTFLDEDQAALLTPDGIVIYDVASGQRRSPRSSPRSSGPPSSRARTASRTS